MKKGNQFFAEKIIINQRYQRAKKNIKHADNTD